MANTIVTEEAPTTLQIQRAVGTEENDSKKPVGTEENDSKKPRYHGGHLKVYWKILSSQSYAAAEIGLSNNPPAKIHMVCTTHNLQMVRQTDQTVS